MGTVAHFPYQEFLYREFNDDDIMHIHKEGVMHTLKSIAEVL